MLQLCWTAFCPCALEDSGPSFPNLIFFCCQPAKKYHLLQEAFQTFSYFDSVRLFSPAPCAHLYQGPSLFNSCSLSTGQKLLEERNHVLFVFMCLISRNFILQYLAGESINVAWLNEWLGPNRFDSLWRWAWKYIIFCLFFPFHTFFSPIYLPSSFVFYFKLHPLLCI